MFQADLEQQRLVSRDEGEQLARQFNLPYVECSAKLRLNVEHAFHDLVRLIRYVMFARLVRVRRSAKGVRFKLVMGPCEHRSKSCSVPRGTVPPFPFRVSTNYTITSSNRFKTEILQKILRI